MSEDFLALGERLKREPKEHLLTQAKRQAEAVLTASLEELLFLPSSWLSCLEEAAASETSALRIALLDLPASVRYLRQVTPHTKHLTCLLEDFLFKHPSHVEEALEELEALQELVEETGTVPAWRHRRSSWSRALESHSYSHLVSLYLEDERAAKEAFLELYLAREVDACREAARHFLEVLEAGALD